jgi:hypothetical protein
MDNLGYMQKLLLICSLFIFIACAPNAKYPHLMVTEAQMVEDCQYLETFAQNADPGRIFYRFRDSDAEQQVLYKADVVGATHVVWVYNNHLGSAAELYKCK